MEKYTPVPADTMTRVSRMAIGAAIPGSSFAISHIKTAKITVTNSGGIFSSRAFMA